MSDDIFYDDFGNGIDDENFEVFHTRREAEECLSRYAMSYIRIKHDKYGNKEYYVFYPIN